MRRETPKMTQQEIIEVLKRTADSWTVSVVNEATFFFSNGRMCVECSDAEGAYGLSEQNKERWTAGVAEIVASVPPEYVQAIPGRLFGMFGRGYSRVYAAPGFKNFTYLNEMYVRVIGESAVPLMHPTKDFERIYFVRDDRVVGVVMPLKGIGPDRDLAEDPEVPFLEDAALYHECKGGL